jgi:hypothetical protein
MDELLVFRSFYTQDEAFSLLGFLTEKGINGTVVKHRPVGEKVYIGVDYDRPFHLKIKGPDFNKANAILDAYILQNLSEIEPDYYLYSFSDEELLEIITKPDEWNNQDIVLAKKILNDRGQIISEQQVEANKLNRINHLEKPDKEGRMFIILGYLLALFFNFLGVLFGLLMINSTKTLPDGRKVFIYEKSSRKHGRNMIIIGLITTSIFLGRIFVNVFF